MRYYYDDFSAAAYMYKNFEFRFKILVREERGSSFYTWNPRQLDLFGSDSRLYLQDESIKLLQLIEDDLILRGGQIFQAFKPDTHVSRDCYVSYLSHVHGGDFYNHEIIFRRGKPFIMPKEEEDESA